MTTPHDVSPVTEEEISLWISALGRICPFFSSLAMFAEHVMTEGIPTAATDGKKLFFNPRFMGRLTRRERLGVFVHELLHAALLHAERRRDRSPELWNVAADIVVNEIVLSQSDLTLPSGALRDTELAQLDVEEVYEVLSRKQTEGEALVRLAASGLGADLSTPDTLEAPGGGLIEGPGMATPPSGDLEGYWKNALFQSESIAGLLTTGQGSIPAAMRRAFDWFTHPCLDWKTMLWRHLVQTPVDFSGFDRRFIGEGLYLEHLEGESLKVAVCIDTSGSISAGTLSTFLAEVLAILWAYPHMSATLFFADAALHGPIQLDSNSDPLAELEPIGGGGTAFEPFFKWLSENQDDHPLAVYLTDGYGSFPPYPPDIPCLWVVPPGGLGSKSFSFGEVSRMIS